MTPAVVRLSDADLVRKTLAFSPSQLLKLAVTEGCPVRERGRGKGTRAFVIVAEFVAWMEQRSRRIA